MKQLSNDLENIKSVMEEICAVQTENDFIGFDDVIVPEPELHCIAVRLDDLLSSGGPEKEFTFRGRQYFMETRYHADTGMR